MNMNEPILATVRRHLQQTRGKWTEVSHKSGVPYHTLTKIAQGKVADPRMSTVQLLLDHFAGEALSPESPEKTLPQTQSPVVHEVAHA